jgi:membrane-associated protein
MQPPAEAPETPGPAPAAARDEWAEAAGWARRNATWLMLAGVAVFIVLPRVLPWQPAAEYLNVFQRLSEWTLRHLERLFKDYGYYVVFFGVLAENSMFLGLLVPGAIILILAGLSAQNGAINIWLVLALAFAATIAGDTVSYFIGRLGWNRALQKTGMGAMMEKVREPLEHNRGWIILGYHFAGYSRVVGPAAAGLFRIPYRKWAPLDYAGGIAWVLAYTLFGVALGMFGLEFGDTKRMARLLELFFTVAVVAAIALALLREARARARQPAPAVVPVEDD